MSVRDTAQYKYKLFEVFTSSDTDGAKIHSQDARLVLSDR